VQHVLAILDYHGVTRVGPALEANDDVRVRRQDIEFVAAIREGRPAALEAPVVLPTLRIVQDAWDRWLAGEGSR